MTILYITNPKKQRAPNSFYRVDILYASGQNFNKNVTYLDAWLADRKIAKRFWLWKDNKMSVTFESSQNNIINSQYFVVRELGRTRSLSGVTKVTALLFKPGNVPSGVGEVDTTGYCSLINTGQIQKSEDSLLNNELCNKLKELEKATYTTSPSFVTGEAPDKDYSIRLRRIQGLLQTQEFTRTSWRGMVAAPIGRMFERSWLGRTRGWESTWKLPATAQKVNAIIEDFLEKARLDNERVLTENDFNKIKQKIETEISKSTKYDKYIKADESQNSADKKKDTVSEPPDKSSKHHRNDIVRGQVDGDIAPVYHEILSILQSKDVGYEENAIPTAAVMTK